MKAIQNLCDKFHRLLNKVLRPVWTITKLEGDYIIIQTFIGLTEFRTSLMDKKSCLDEVVHREQHDKDVAKNFRDFL